MVQWPPSPSVEDEATSLLNEHSIHLPLSAFKSDDQPAIDRGSVDQYPIIIDSPDSNNNGRRDLKQPRPAKHHFGDLGSSDDSAGPATPPPLLRKEDKAPSARATGSRRSPTSNISAELPQTHHPGQQSDRGRPQISRIQTDIGDDVRAMASGVRRPPSPYAFTRSPTLRDLNKTDLPQSENFLSPVSAAPQRNYHINPGEKSSTSANLDAATPLGIRRIHESAREEHERYPGHSSQPGSTVNAATAARNHGPQLPSVTIRPQSSGTSAQYRSTDDMPRKMDSEAAQSRQSHNRQFSEEFAYASSGEESAKLRNLVLRARNPTGTLTDSPYTSSTEDSAREYGRKSGRSSNEDQKKMRRKSSSRRERPMLKDSVSSIAPDEVDSRYFRREPQTRSQLNTMTPVSGNLGNTSMEDYFAKAFKDNERKQSQRADGPRYSGSTLASPLASPPRTPIPEGQYREHFDITLTAQRPAVHSRPPSLEESQIKDAKARRSLLSVATTAASFATKVVENTPYNPSRSLDPGFSGSPSRTSGGQRLGRPSPMPDELYGSSRITQHGLTQSPVADRGPYTSPYDARFLSRGNTFNVETTQAYNYSYPHPQRAQSYSGPEHIQPWNGPCPDSAARSTFAVPNSAISNYNPVSTQSRSARSSVYAADFVPPILDLTALPRCPRPQPVVGYHDWYTIKEMSNLDICPTCAGMFGSTKYRSRLVSSLPRPYNEPSVCAMSKPWVRIAFMQSLRQNRPDLSYIRIVSSLPKDTRPCAGSEKDIRHWFHVVDPLTKEPVPDFFVCSACIHAVDTVFPDVCTLFTRPKPKLNQERNCSMHTASKHFPSIIDQLDQASALCKGRRWKSSDVEELVRHLRRVGRHKPCPKDDLQMSRTWHFMPDLPEFTVCEECYNEVVCPLQDRSIARDVTRSPKNVSIRRTNGGDLGVSCQLYSERMRKLFREAVESRNMAQLRDAVKVRVSTQHRLNALNRLYEQDAKVGISRSQEVDRNHAIWHSLE